MVKEDKALQIILLIIPITKNNIKTEIVGLQTRRVTTIGEDVLLRIKHWVWEMCNVGGCGTEIQRTMCVCAFVCVFKSECECLFRRFVCVPVFVCKCNSNVHIISG